MLTAAPLLLALSLAASPGPVTLDVVRADVRTLLQGLADKGQVNLWLDDDVQGRVTLKLVRVPWSSALDAVLAASGLGQERAGRVLRVAPLGKLAQEAQARARLRVAREESGPLRTVLIPVNHARAEELAPLVRAQLSPRGKVVVDARTNTLIVTDVEP